jgi:hypothetical protein
LDEGIKERWRILFPKAAKTAILIASRLIIKLGLHRFRTQVGETLSNVAFRNRVNERSYGTLWPMKLSEEWGGVKFLDSIIVDDIPIVPINAPFDENDDNEISENESHENEFRDPSQTDQMLLVVVKKIEKFAKNSEAHVHNTKNNRLLHFH